MAPRSHFAVSCRVSQFLAVARTVSTPHVVQISRSAHFDFSSPVTSYVFSFRGSDGRHVDFEIRSRAAGGWTVRVWVDGASAGSRAFTSIIGAARWAEGERLALLEAETAGVAAAPSGRRPA
jgi:hypothetical protein